MLCLGGGNPQERWRRDERLEKQHREWGNVQHHHPNSYNDDKTNEWKETKYLPSSVAKFGISHSVLLQSGQSLNPVRQRGRTIQQ